MSALGWQRTSQFWGARSLLMTSDGDSIAWYVENSYARVERIGDRGWS
jgi:hypothetical protein